MKRVETLQYNTVLIFMIVQIYFVNEIFHNEYRQEFYNSFYAPAHKQNQCPCYVWLYSLSLV
jgi:hypothetical protein